MPQIPRFGATGNAKIGGFLKYPKFFSYLCGLSGCGAVGSALGLGPRGPPFESGYPDMNLEKNRLKEPGFGRLVLGALALGCAILVGFVLGLRSGDRGLKQPPVTGLLEMPLLGAPVAVLDSVFAEADSMETVEPAAPAVEPAPVFTKPQIAQGVEYLASHNRWNRDEMEQIPVLVGLWDRVNTYSLEEIRQYNDILNSTPLTAVVEGLEQRPKQGYYAAKTDHVITLSTYIKRLR